MRGAGAANNPSEVSTMSASDAAEIRSLRLALASLEAQVLEFRNRLQRFESRIVPSSEGDVEKDGQLGISAVPPLPLRSGPTEEAANLPPVAIDESIRDVLGYGFNLAGVVALALGVAFVVRYTSAQNASSALGAVIAGSLGLLGLAFLFRRRQHARLGMWLEGAAVAIGYLSAYAAFSVWHSMGLVLLLSTAITIAGIGLALARKSQAIAVFAVWGAVMTPLMMSGASKGQDPASALLFAYLALITLSTLVVSRFYYWPWQAASALVSTHFLAWMWYGDHHGGNTTLVLLFPCVTYAVFFLRPVVRVVAPEWHDKGIAAVNPIFFFLALVTLLDTTLLPLLLLGLGIVQAIACVALPRRTGLAAVNLTLAGLCLVPATYLISPLLAAYSWVAIGVIVGVIGLKYSSWPARMSAYLLVIAGMALYPRAFVVVPAVLAGRWFLKRAWTEMPSAGDLEWLARWGLSLGMVVAGLAAVSLEIRALLSLTAFAPAAAGLQFFYSLGMVAYATALVALGKDPSRRVFRACGWVVLAALTAKVFLLDLPSLSGMWRIGSLMLLAASLLIVSAGRERQRPNQAETRATEQH